MTPSVLFVAEPPPGFLLQPPLVVDCSVMIAILFEEPTRDEALRLLAGKALQAPELLDHEVVSVATKKAEQGVEEQRVRAALGIYADQDIELHRTDAIGQYELARRYRLSAYDAAYLWLAGKLKTSLATFDRKLAAAARAHLASLT